MPQFITLSHLTWSTPDGRPVLNDINLRFGQERVGLVGRNGAGKTTLLKLISGELVPSGGLIDVSGKLHVLRQNLKAKAGETVADLFGARDAFNLLAMAQAGQATAEELADVDWMMEHNIAEVMSRFGVDAYPSTLLSKLSGGQRTKAALAALHHASPDFAVLDEPTNNLDQEGRRAVLEFLGARRGGAIVVSHDRELLETMDAIVELSSLGASRYGGNWSHYRQTRELELASAQQDLDDAEKSISDAKRSTQEAAERKARQDRAGAKKAAKGDMPRIVAGGLKMAAQQTSGNAANRATRQENEAVQQLQKARERIEILQPLTISLPSTKPAATKAVLKLVNVTGGHAAEHPVIRDLSFEMTGPQRVAITGSNGSGKTTLLSLITGVLPVFQGEVKLGVDLAYLDQDVGILDRRMSILDNFLRLNPDAAENECRAALARFMFRAEAALQHAGSLSGGQLLRAGLACVLGGSLLPRLLVLDEPTNHLDLDAIAAVEAGLKAYDGAILVVSHDETFLSNVGIDRRICLD
jgi:ATPase subunit of ABC transporter with duplicated ATPase domains